MKSERSKLVKKKKESNWKKGRITKRSRIREGGEQ